MGISGEYWIQDDGYPIYADGDVGDYNHEGYVIGSVAMQLADEVGFPTKYDEVDPDELLRYIDENELEGQVDQESLAVLSGSMDARDYAMQKWGWKTVRDHNVETWTATPEDLKIIGAGIAEILGQEMGDEEDEEELEFYVYVGGTGQSKTYTLAQLEAGGLNTGMQLPAQTNIARLNQGWNNIAANQNRDADLQNMHPHYQQQKFPFGDSIISFRQFMTENR